MSNKKSFGIGCFHFGIRKKPPFQFTGKQYISELDIILSKISNITDINISSDEEFENYEEKIVEPTPDLTKDRGFFPQPAHLEIEFKIYIPFRVQSELCGMPEKFLFSYTENFQVRVIHSYYMPVCIVECIEPNRDPDPAKSVQIIREFIIKALKTKKSDYIRFEFLGLHHFIFIVI